MVNKVKEFITVWLEKISELLKREDLDLYDPEYYSLMQEVELLAKKHLPIPVVSKILEFSEKEKLR